MCLRCQPSNSFLRGYRSWLKVVALNGRPEARGALAAGMDAFVSKGDPLEQLLVTVRNCWERSYGK